MLKQRFFSSENNLYSNDDNAPHIILIFAFFFIGCVLGAFFGANFSPAALRQFGLLDLASDDGGFFANAFRFLRFHILAFLLGTSFLGVALVPLLTMLKGFVFSCTSATIISAYSPRGIIMVLVLLGIPSLFSIPAFIAIGDNAFSRSGKLLSLFRGNSRAILYKTDRTVLLCIPILAIGLLAEARLVPYLISLLG